MTRALAGGERRRLRGGELVLLGAAAVFATVCVLVAAGWGSEAVGPFMSAGPGYMGATTYTERDGTGTFAAVPPRPGDWQLTSTVTTNYSRACGVRCDALLPGQALAFQFQSEYRQGWTMAGVAYPLWLWSRDTGSWTYMQPGVCCYMDGTGRYFVEVRPR